MILPFQMLKYPYNNNRKSASTNSRAVIQLLLLVSLFAVEKVWKYYKNLFFPFIIFIAFFYVINLIEKIIKMDIIDFYFFELDYVFLVVVIVYFARILYRTFNVCCSKVKNDNLHLGFMKKKTVKSECEYKCREMKIWSHFYIRKN